MLSDQFLRWSQISFNIHLHWVRVAFSYSKSKFVILFFFLKCVKFVWNLSVNKFNVLCTLECFIISYRERSTGFLISQYTLYGHYFGLNCSGNNLKFGFSKKILLSTLPFESLWNTWAAFAQICNRLQLIPRLG